VAVRVVGYGPTRRPAQSGDGSITVTPSSAPRPPASWTSLPVFLLLVVGGGLLVGALTGPDAWFASLRKPSFNPPNWLFAPVWTVLYVLIAIAGWRVWSRRTGTRADSRALGLWWLQLGLNFLWSPVFFAAHRIDLALAVIALLLLSIIGFMATAWARDRVAALLFAPYALWVAFATALNAAFWMNNGGS
jgi:tryptophan-rich sensory protein